MTDAAKQIPHPDLGEVGELGAIGDLGSNAIDHPDRIAQDAAGKAPEVKVPTPAQSSAPVAGSPALPSAADLDAVAAEQAAAAATHEKTDAEKQADIETALVAAGTAPDVAKEMAANAVARAKG